MYVPHWTNCRLITTIAMIIGRDLISLRFILSPTGGFF
jgi:hypothetical protein